VIPWFVVAHFITTSRKTESSVQITYYVKVPVKSKLKLFTLLAHITNLVVNNLKRASEILKKIFYLSNL